MDALTPLATARRVVVKTGSALAVDARAGAPNTWRLADIAASMSQLLERGAELVIVSSGAVALGRRRLGLPERALSLPEKQAAAAAGQVALMRAWEAALAPHGRPVGQALLTVADTETRRRWLNARATLEALLGARALVVVNENDTVATEEIRYGDNDRLAARVAQLIGADALVLLSDVDGLYTADPRKDPNAVRLERVEAVTPEIEALAAGADPSRRMGTGGMATKIAAARIACDAGCATVIANGERADPLGVVLRGEAGTWFAASASPDAARRRWIAHALAPAGAIKLDAGAVAAVRSGKSLLPAGAVAVEGGFERGDAVKLLDAGGAEFGRALAGYDAVDARAILGKRSEDIEAVLGYRRGAALAHASDIVVFAKSKEASS